MFVCLSANVCSSVMLDFAKPFLNFYRRYYDLISKFQVGLKFLLLKRLSEPEFYGDLVNNLK